LGFFGRIGKFKYKLFAIIGLMTSGKCAHPWNKTKKGTFVNGHEQVNNGAGCFKKGRTLPEDVKFLNKELGKKRYGEGIHPFFKKNLLAQELANKENWYGIGKKNWKLLSKKILKRDDYTCQSCGVSLKERKHNTHHIIPFSISHDNSENNLVSLCIPCHTSIEHFTRLQYVGGINGQQNGCRLQEGNISPTKRSS
jgi:hypothetical protein